MNGFTSNRLKFFINSYYVLHLPNAINVICFLMEYFFLIPLIAEQSFFINNACNSNNNIKYISLYYYFQKLQNNQHHYHYIFLIIVYFFIIYHTLSVLCLGYKFSNGIYTKIHIIFYQMVFLRIIAIYIVDVYVSFLIYAIYNGTFIECFLSSMLVLIGTYFFISNLSSYYVIFPIIFSEHKYSYPYTTLSAQFDTFIFVIKTLICIQKNLIQHNNDSISSQSKYLALFILVSLFFLCIFMINIIYRHSNRFLENFIVNKLRLIFCILCVKWGATNLIFDNKNNIWIYIFGFTLSLLLTFYILLYMTEITILLNLLKISNHHMKQIIYYIITKINTNKKQKEDTTSSNKKEIPDNDIQKYKDIKISLLCHSLKCGSCAVCKTFSNFNDSTPTTNFSKYNDEYIRYFYILYINNVKCRKISSNQFGSEFYPQFFLDYLSILSVFLESFSSETSKPINPYCNYNFRLRFRIKSVISKYVSYSSYSEFNQHVLMNFMLIQHILFSPNHNRHNNDKDKNDNKTPGKFGSAVDLKILSVLSFISETISSTVNKLSSFIDNELKKLDDFIELSISLSHLHKKQLLNLLNQRDYIRCYPIVISRFIYEEILNTPVNKIEGMIRNELKEIRDNLSKSFQNDSLINIKIDFDIDLLSNENMLLLRCGNDLIENLNKSFFILFPREFKEEGIYEFKYFLNTNCKATNTNSNRNTFEYLINYNNDISYMNMMFFFISNTLKYNELVLTGEYNVTTKGIMITMEKEYNGTKKEILYRLSKKLCHLLSIKINMFDFEEKGNSTIHMTLDSISNMEQYGNKANKNTVYELFVDKFQLIYYKILTKNAVINGKNIFSEEERRMSQFNILRRTSGPKKRYKKLFFSLKKIIQKKNEKALYKVYLVNASAYNPVIQEDNNTFDSSEGKLHKKNSQFKNTTFSMFSKNIGTICDESSIQMSTNSVILSQNLNRTDKIRNSENIISQKSQTQYSRYKVVIFSNVAILIILSITLLILEITNNQEFFRIYTFYTSFRTFLRLYYHFISYAYSVVCVGDPSVSDDYCVNYYDEYTKYYNERYNDTFNISQLTQRELTMKVSDFMSRAINMSSQVYKLNEERVTELYYSDYNYTKITVDLKTNKIGIIEIETTFLNGLKMLSNSFQIMIQNYTFASHPIYIFSMNTTDFSYIKDPLSLKDWQIEYYNTMLNYQKFLLTWNQIKKVLDDIKSGLLKRIQFLMLYFVIGMFGLENILVFLLLVILDSFINIIKIRVNHTMYKLKDKTFFSIFKKKISNLQILSKYYEQDPSAILDNITQLYSEYSLITKQNNAITTKKQIDSSNELIIIDKDIKAEKTKEDYILIKKYNKYTKKYIHIIIGIEIFFILLFLIYVFVLILIINQTSTVFDIIEGNTIAENNVYNELTLFQVMILTNQTQGMISSYVNQVSNDNFIVEDLFSSIETIYKSDSDISTIPSLFPKLESVLNFDCYEMFETFKDPRLKKLNTKYPELTYYQKLGDMCNRYDVMKYKKDQLMYQYMFYEISIIIQNINDHSYKGLLKAISQIRYFNVATMHFFIYRPLRSWVNGTPYAIAIDNATNLQLNTVVAYILCLIVSQIIISFVLVFYLFKPLQKMNKKLGLVKRVFNIKKS